MDDLSTVFYIIIGIIYFIYSAIKKGKPKNIPRQQPGSPVQDELDQGNEAATGEEMPRRPSFEDLLREFTQEEPPAAPKEVVEETTYETYEEPVNTYVPDTTYPTYQEEKKAPSIYDEYQNIQVTEEDIVRRPLFKASEADEAPVNKFGAELREMLKNRDGLKKAIIINEILKPKYF
ncbi:hypothetical protein QQ020_02995 [Fulvivirgaceae bacterium BMA12]|uniref:Uncharacterized protein n=1 Tax=Agaribacillus aureus TaxID=3051825 RepID=A0ABT8L1P0_9BACT|nr:hypothetical protein [Fulvivirgaceae bacterium BMA12]